MMRWLYRWWSDLRMSLFLRLGMKFFLVVDIYAPGEDDEDVGVQAITFAIDEEVLEKVLSGRSVWEEGTTDVSTKSRCS